MSGIPDPQQTTPTSEGLLPPTEPIPELQKLGSTLVAARHQRGIDLELLAERLRIGASQLRALETGDHTHLPEGVFVIALARRVASALDLNIDEAVQALRGSRLMMRPQPRPGPIPLALGPAAGTRRPGPSRSLGFQRLAALLPGSPPWLCCSRCKPGGHSPQPPPGSRRCQRRRDPTSSSTFKIATEGLRAQLDPSAPDRWQGDF